MKSQPIKIQDGSKEASGVLLIPTPQKDLGIILGHGAGGNMNAPFMNFFHQSLAEAGYPSLKFNFFYSEAKRKVPDPQPLLLKCFEQAIEMMPVEQVVIGGKSMGGRMASYIADHPRVRGLLFLGYPLHPPGKQDQLRDQHLYNIHKPMLFVSGKKDPFAQIDLLKSTLNRIGNYASYHLVEGAGHSLEVGRSSGRTNQDVLHYSRQVILDWLKTV
ncbi:MAG TPA: alpha/beta family hydrolase [Acidobacteriota bacterium]|nr:alpha/beta family hydrolase [Acidobacteriota bacterium]